jgi:hypothetical protein
VEFCEISTRVKNSCSLSSESLSTNFVFQGNVEEIKEVLQRENQGLKVYSIDGSSVFSMTGTYF